MKILYGSSTRRAMKNFPVSGRRFPRSFLYALGQLKLSAAKVNMKLGCLTAQQGVAIRRAAKAVRDGRHDHQFPVDIFQTGSGTSTNMNANEVIASLSSSGTKFVIHPNDHVNKGQSSNDVIPSAIHIAVLLSVKRMLVPEIQKTILALKAKEKKFGSVRKIGRTHLQDATPVTLGQEFGGYAAQMEKALKRIEVSAAELRELPLGGTAVGTGINTHPRFAREVCRDISLALKERFVEAPNHFEAQGARDTCVALSGQLKALAVAMMKIANDIRWLASGPRAGLNEIRLPGLQPGSSIMPGKVNPVICESVMQVAAEVIGNDTAVTVAGQSGSFELNVMMPVLAYNLLESVRLSANVLGIFREKCIRGIEVNREVCESRVEQSLMLATPLAPVLGYDRAALVARKAHREGKNVREVVLEEGLIPAGRLKKLLDIEKMI